MGTKCMLKDITFSRWWITAAAGIMQGDGNVNIYYVVLGGVVLDIFFRIIAA